MYSEFTIDPAVLQAYLETHYLVFGNVPLTLQVGRANPDLANLYKTQRVESCAFITACNPLSQQMDDAVNAHRQAILAAELHRRSLIFIEGIGQHPSGKWTGEASFLVWGLSLETSKALGSKHDQNAIVWCGPDAVPQLITLR